MKQSRKPGASVFGQLLFQLVDGFGIVSGNTARSDCGGFGAQVASALAFGNAGIHRAAGAVDSAAMPRLRVMTHKDRLTERNAGRGLAHVGALIGGFGAVLGAVCCCFKPRRRSAT